MCISAWIWLAHPIYPLILVFNRDELHDRPTKPLGWWGNDSRKILGGRDLQAGGTWMGCTINGKVAFLTNVMEPDTIPTASTRGNLPVRFLESGQGPMEFAAEIIKEADQYNGFNLVLADLITKMMVYISNRPKGAPISVQVVAPGLHVLTNARLDAPWHKAGRLRQTFKELLHKYGKEDIPGKVMVEKLLMDRVEASEDRLPKTGCDSTFELKLSSIFVDMETKRGRYGTRSHAALSVKLNGKVSFYERYLEDSMWKDCTVEYQLENFKKREKIDCI